MPSAAEQLASSVNFGAIAKATELKQRIIFTLLALVVYRLGTYLPIPGINPGALDDIFNQNTQKYINFSLKPFMGVTLSKGTVCNLNFPKNSLIMQLESDDVDFDIEKKTDETI